MGAMHHDDSLVHRRDPRQSVGKGGDVPSGNSAGSEAPGDSPTRATAQKPARALAGWVCRGECNLFRRQAHIIAFWWALWYVVCPLAMNVAYYRYEAGPRLRDWGFEVIPELPEKYRHMAEVPHLILLTWNILYLLVAVRPSAGRHKRVFGVNMIRRWTCVFVACHTLRAATFLGTTLPGAAEHCLPDYDWRANQPETPYRITPNPGWPTKNCGDLLFSGHMLETTLNVLVLSKYTEPTTNCSRATYRRLMCIAALVLIIQAVLTIASRNHYTADVVIAVYLVPLVWHAHETLRPEDMQPDVVSTAQPGQWEFWKMIAGARATFHANAHTGSRGPRCFG